MMMDYFRQLRPKQWYKNFLIFLPLIFSGNLTNINAITQSIIAFASFCMLSSATYTINDLADKKKDNKHPEKKNRPIASEKISTIEAILLALTLVTSGLLTSLHLPIEFTYTALGYFFLSQLYTIWLKHEAFADIITIATNFVIRAAAGAFAISVWVSPWLILGVFFLALFLLLGKRKSELTLLQNKAEEQRKTLKAYDIETTNRLSALATTALLICYTLYVFFGEHGKLFITMPAATYAIFRYDHFINTGNKIARHPEYVFTDWRMTATMLLWLSITLLVLYF